MRQARPDEAATFTKWALSTPGNEIDSGVLTYKTTTARVAFDSDGPIVFQIIQRPLHMDSIAVRPGAAPHEVANALRALLQDTISTANAEGSGEVYFVGSEDTVPTIVQNQGLFEKMPYSLYRLKLKDLEKPIE